jgi:TnpA family transposase
MMAFPRIEEQTFLCETLSEEQAEAEGSSGKNNEESRCKQEGEIIYAVG